MALLNLFNCSCAAVCARVRACDKDGGPNDIKEWDPDEIEKHNTEISRYETPLFGGVKRDLFPLEVVGEDGWQTRTTTPRVRHGDAASRSPTFQQQSIEPHSLQVEGMPKEYESREHSRSEDMLQTQANRGVNAALDTVNAILKALPEGQNDACAADASQSDSSAVAADSQLGSDFWRIRKLVQAVAMESGERKEQDSELNAERKEQNPLPAGERQQYPLKDPLPNVKRRQSVDPSTKAQAAEAEPQAARTQPASYDIKQQPGKWANVETVAGIPAQPPEPEPSETEPAPAEIVQPVPRWLQTVQTEPTPAELVEPAPRWLQAVAMEQKQEDEQLLASPKAAAERKQQVEHTQSPQFFNISEQAAPVQGLAVQATPVQNAPVQGVPGQGAPVQQSQAAAAAAAAAQAAPGRQEAVPNDTQLEVNGHAAPESQSRLKKEDDLAPDEEEEQQGTSGEEAHDEEEEEEEESEEEQDGSPGQRAAKIKSWFRKRTSELGERIRFNSKGGDDNAFFFNSSDVTGAFLRLVAPDGKSWVDYCAPVDPTFGSDKTVIGRWAECMRAAVVLENAAPKWKDDPAYIGSSPTQQVEKYFEACGHSDHLRALQNAKKTFQSALAAEADDGISSSRCSSRSDVASESLASTAPCE